MCAEEECSRGEEGRILFGGGTLHAEVGMVHDDVGGVHGDSDSVHLGAGDFKRCRCRS